MKNKNILKDAAKAAILSGAFIGVARFMENKDSKNRAFIESTFAGISTAVGVALSEGSKAILKNKSSTFKAASKSTSITKSVFNACVQSAIESANDINQYHKGKINKSECITRVSENTGGVIGSMILGRAAIVLGTAALPALSGVAGAVTLGIVGGYVGEIVGKKIVKGEIFGNKDSVHTKVKNTPKTLNLAALTKEIKLLKKD